MRRRSDHRFLRDKPQPSSADHSVTRHSSLVTGRIRFKNIAKPTRVEYVLSRTAGAEDPAIRYDDGYSLKNSPRPTRSPTKIAQPDRSGGNLKIDNRYNRARLTDVFPCQTSWSAQCYDKSGASFISGGCWTRSASMRRVNSRRLPDYLGDEKFSLSTDAASVSRRFPLGDREPCARRQTDDAILAGARSRIPRTDEECHVLERFIAKLGWRDERATSFPSASRKAASPANRSKLSSTTSNSTKGRDPVADRSGKKSKFQFDAD